MMISLIRRGAGLEDAAERATRREVWLGMDARMAGMILPYIYGS